MGPTNYEFYICRGGPAWLPFFLSVQAFRLSSRHAVGEESLLTTKDVLSLSKGRKKHKGKNQETEKRLGTTDFTDYTDYRKNQETEKDDITERTGKEATTATIRRFHRF